MNIAYEALIELLKQHHRETKGQEMDEPLAVRFRRSEPGMSVKTSVIDRADSGDLIVDYDRNGAVALVEFH